MDVLDRRAHGVTQLGVAGLVNAAGHAAHALLHALLRVRDALWALKVAHQVQRCVCREVPARARPTLNVFPRWFVS